MAEEADARAEDAADSEREKTSTLQQMLAIILQERTKDLSSISVAYEGFELVSINKFWTNLFTEYFIEGNSTDESRDDMVFYVRKSHVTRGRIPQIKTDIQVYRRDSKKLPALTDRGIDWEETVYLNIILHQFEYSVTCAVCTRTSEKDLQILKKFTQKVYPSPSRHRMDSKGTEEEIAYPNIFFTVDNFEEAFGDIIVRDSEIICVELVATDHEGKFQGVVFLGSIRYEALKKVYDSRASLTSRVAQHMSLGWFKGHKRVEFVRMRGPHGKGFAEMAVSRVKGSGPETPDLENFPVNDFEEEQNSYVQRRMSDPSSAIGSLVRGSFRKVIQKSRSETENVDNIGTDNCSEVEAATIQDEFASVEQYNGFWEKSFGQAWHWFREQRRATSVALHSYLTYVTLPWYRIIADPNTSSPFSTVPKFTDVAIKSRSA